MARGFNITAQLHLAGPNNVRAVVSSLQRQLGAVTANVNVRISPTATRAVNALNSRVTALNANLVLATANTNTLNAAWASLSRTAAGFSSSVAGANRSMTNTANSCRAAGRAAQAAGNDIREFGRVAGLAIRRFAGFSLATGIIFGFVRAAQDGIEQAIGFNREMVRLSQVTRISVGGLKGIEDEITRLSTSLGVSSKELINVSTMLAQAELSAKDTKTALEALAKSSLAPSFRDMAQTGEAAVAIFKQFDLKAKDLEASLGSINSVSAAFAVEADDIIKAVRLAGGVFAASSKGVVKGTEALNQFIATFASVRATTRASAESIATGMNTIFARIQRSGTIEFLKQFGIELLDLEGKFVGPFEALNRLSDGLSKIDPRDTKFARIVEELGGFRQLRNVIPLIQQMETRTNALGVAQAGQTSLSRDAIIAQQSLANQFAKVREQFLALMRATSETGTFKVLVDLTVKLGSALISTANAAKPLIPFLTLLASIKAVGAITSFGSGFFRGIRGNSGPGGGPAGTPVIGAGGSPSSRINPAVVTNTNAVQGNTLAMQQLTVAVQGLLHARFGVPFPTGAASPLPRRFSRGGLVPGQGNTDSVDTTLTRGEFVLRKKAVSAIGADRLQGINDNPGKGLAHFAKGGPVIGFTEGGPTEAQLAQLQIYREALGEEKFQKKVSAGNVSGALPTTAIKMDTLLGSLKRSLSSNQGVEKKRSENRSRLSADSNVLRIQEKIAGLFFSPLNSRDNEPQFVGVSTKNDDISDGTKLKLASREGIVGKDEKDTLSKFKRKYPEVAAQIASFGINKDAHDTFAEQAKPGVLGLIKNIANSLATKLGHPVQPNLSTANADTLLRNIGEEALLGRLFEGTVAHYTDSVRDSGQNASLDFDLKTGQLGRFKQLFGDKIANYNVGDAKLTESSKSLKHLVVKAANSLANNEFKAYAKGGDVRDSIHAKVMPGEFILRKEAASSLGEKTLNKLNHAEKIPGFADGGWVTHFGGGARGNRRRNPTPLQEFEFTSPADISQTTAYQDALNGFKTLAGLTGGELKVAMKTFASEMNKGSKGLRKLLGGPNADKAYGKAVEQAEKFRTRLGGSAGGHGFGGTQDESGLLGQVAGRTRGIRGVVSRHASTVGVGGALLAVPAINGILGQDSPAAAGIGGAVAGAATGFAVAGAPGAVIGGFVAAVDGYTTAIKAAEMDKVMKDLASSAKNLDTVFESFNLGGSSAAGLNNAFAQSTQSLFRLSDVKFKEPTKNSLTSNVFEPLGVPNFRNRNNEVTTTELLSRARGGGLSGTISAAASALNPFGDDTKNQKEIQRFQEANAAEFAANGEPAARLAADILGKQLSSGRKLVSSDDNEIPVLTGTGQQFKEQIKALALSGPDRDRNAEVIAKSKDKDATALRLGTIRLKVLDEEAARQKKLTDAMQDVNKEVDLSLQRFTAMGEAIARVAANTEAFTNNADRLLASFSGDAKIGKLTPNTSNVIGNIGGYSKKEVDATLLGIERSTGNNPIVKELTRQVGAAKLITTELPKIFKESILEDDKNARNREPGDETGDTLARAIENKIDALPIFDAKGNSDTTTKSTIKSQIRDKLASRQGKSEEEFLKEIGDFAELLAKPTAAAQKSLEELAKVMDAGKQAFAAGLDQLTSITLLKSKALSRAEDIRIENLLDIARLQGKIITPDEANAPVTARLNDLTGGIQNPGDILNRFKELEAKRVDLADKVQNAPLGSEDLVKFGTELSDVNSAISKTKEALELLATDTRKAAAIREKLNQIEQKAGAGQNLIETLATAGPQELAKIARQGLAFNSFRATGKLPQRLEDRQGVFEFAKLIKPLIAAQDPEKARLLDQNLARGGAAFLGGKFGRNPLTPLFNEAIGPAVGDKARDVAIDELRKVGQVQEAAASALAKIVDSLKVNYGEIITNQLSTLSTDIVAQITRAVDAFTSVISTDKYGQRRPEDEQIDAYQAANKKRKYNFDNKYVVPPIPRAAGGLVMQHQTSDFAYKSDNQDIVAAPGEVVMRRRAVGKYGKDFLLALNGGQIPMPKHMVFGGDPFKDKELPSPVAPPITPIAPIFQRRITDRTAITEAAQARRKARQQRLGTYVEVPEKEDGSAYTPDERRIASARARGARRKTRVGDDRGLNDVITSAPKRARFSDVAPLTGSGPNGRATAGERIAARTAKIGSNADAFFGGNDDDIVSVPGFGSITRKEYNERIAENKKRTESRTSALAARKPDVDAFLAKQNKGTTSVRGVRFSAEAVARVKAKTDALAKSKIENRDRIVADNKASALARAQRRALEKDTALAGDVVKAPDTGKDEYGFTTPVDIPEVVRPGRGKIDSIEDVNYGGAGRYSRGQGGAFRRKGAVPAYFKGKYKPSQDVTRTSRNLNSTPVRNRAEIDFEVKKRQGKIDKTPIDIFAGKDYSKEEKSIATTANHYDFEQKYAGKAKERIDARRKYVEEMEARLQSKIDADKPKEDYRFKRRPRPKSTFYADGGYIAQLHKGEGVVTARAMQKHPGAVAALNNDKVPSYKTGFSGSGPNGGPSGGSGWSMTLDASALKSISGFTGAIDQFGKYIKELQAIVIPSTITISGKLDPVELILKGESALASAIIEKMGPDLQAMLERNMKGVIRGNQVTGETSEGSSPAILR